MFADITNKTVTKENIGKNSVNSETLNIRKQNVFLMEKVAYLEEMNEALRSGLKETLDNLERVESVNNQLYKRIEEDKEIINQYSEALFLQELQKDIN